MQDLIVLNHEDYTHLKHELKDADLDLCYMAQSARPVRLRWSPERMHEAAFLHQVIQRRPADPSYRLASVRRSKPGTWFWPDQLTITFHAVRPQQDAALQQYLDTHQVSTAAQIGDQHTDDGHAHATPKTYIQVAIVLALITAFEVSLLFVPEAVRPPRWALFLVLLLLSAIKFGIVVSFFMHLRYDHRLYAGLFVVGLVVAAGTMLALLALFREQPEVTRPTATARTTAAVAVAGSDAGGISGHSAGARVFQHYGCGACHTVATVPGARGTLGPGLDGLAQRAATRIPGMPAEDYIRQSVDQPEAHIVKGYLKLMPALRDQMQAQEFTDLLALLRTL